MSTVAAATHRGEGPDRIQSILADLVRDRQALRGSSNADGSLLEANRRSIVFWQAELAQALLAEHGFLTVA